MDKNTIYGLVIIFGLFIGFSYINKPSEEELKALKEKQKVEQEQKVEEQKQAAIYQEEQERIKNTVSDSAALKEQIAKLGDFASNSQGEQKFYTIENKNIKITVSTLGGKIYSSELKNYKTNDSLPLILFNGDQNKLGLNFYTIKGNAISTNDLYFKTDNEPSIKVSDSKKSLSMKLYAGENKYIEYNYSLEADGYEVDFDINFVGLENDIAMGGMELLWQEDMLAQELGRKWENESTSMYYKNLGDEVEYLSGSSDDQEENLTKLKWVAYKTQFFSSILYAKEEFDGARSLVSKIYPEEDSINLKNFKATLDIPYNRVPNYQIPLKFYFLPTQYKLLKNYGEDFNKMIPLGWGIFGWTNEYFIIPLFNWLGSMFTSYGLIILLLTVIIKSLLFPLTYKSYISTAKMRVLKPQIDEINSKIPESKKVERQQATMALYKKVGVNPMGGCLPMLVQFPFLIALFRFFPASIELRQQSFLWATDLSTYDSILQLPFTIPMYGAHVSLFTLLMGISIVLTTIVNGNQMNTGSTMPGMKTMMYLMPVMMLLWFNSYAAGLSYYYFIANMITFAQTMIIRSRINDEDILKKLQTKKVKPKKKSSFQERLEKMAKEKGYKK